MLGMGDAHNPNLTSEVTNSFGLPINQFFISCLFSMADCSMSDWAPYYDPKYGLFIKIIKRDLIEEFSNIM
jgi:hypothetical protein